MGAQISMLESMQSVAVYCGSATGNSPAYTQAAQELGTELARRGLNLVYGGGNIGLMREVAEACLAAGGTVTGVMPQSLVDLEISHPGLTTLEVVGSMAERKTRMEQLSRRREAFIRPSPSGGSLGGVARRTREAMLLCEAAGFDVVLVETVGVGQSEVTVANMVDTFTFLTLARTGDQLQGIKKGVLELADVVAVNKADGDHVVEARVAARELSSALRLIHPRGSLWRPPVLTQSAVEGTGIPEFWDAVLRHRSTLQEAGEFDRRRRQQQVDWTWTMVRDAILGRVEHSDGVRSVRSGVEASVQDGSLTPALAAQRILDAFDGR